MSFLSVHLLMSAEVPVFSFHTQMMDFHTDAEMRMHAVAVMLPNGCRGFVKTDSNARE